MNSLFLKVCLMFTFILLVPGISLGADVISLLPAEAEIIIYVNVEQLLRSELFQKTLAVTLKSALDNDENFKDFVRATGIDPLRDLKSIVGVGARAKPGETLPSHLLIIITGKFNEKKIVDSIREISAKEKRIELVRERGHMLIKFTHTTQSGNMEFYATVLDEQRMIFGFKNDILVALDQDSRQAKPIIRDKQLYEALASLDPTTVFYSNTPGFVATTISGFDDPDVNKFLQGVVADPVTAKLLAKITTSRIDVRVAADIQLRCILDVTDNDAAKEVKPLLQKGCDQIKSLIRTVVLQNPQLKQIEDIFNTLGVKGKGKTITLEMSVSGKAISDLLKLSK